MDLPVGFACDVHPAEVAAVVFGVCAPKQQLAAWLSCGVSERKAKSHQHQRQGEENPSRCPQNTHQGIWGVYSSVSSTGDKQLVLNYSMSV